MRFRYPNLLTAAANKQQWRKPAKTKRKRNVGTGNLLRQFPEAAENSKFKFKKVLLNIEILLFLSQAKKYCSLMFFFVQKRILSIFLRKNNEDLNLKEDDLNIGVASINLR